MPAESVPAAGERPVNESLLESIARIAREAIGGDSADHYNALRDILSALAVVPPVVGHPMLTPEEMDRYGAWWLSEAAAAVPSGVGTDERDAIFEAVAELEGFAIEEPKPRHAQYLRDLATRLRAALAAARPTEAGEPTKRSDK